MFRKDAVEHKVGSFYGDIIVTQFSFVKYVNLGVTALVVAGVILSFFVKYQEKQSVDGWVEHESGFFKVSSRQTGVIQTLHVNETDYVEKGDVLLHINTAKNIQDGSTLESSLTQETIAQITMLNNQVLLVNKQYDQIAAEKQNQLKGKHKQSELINSQLDAMRDREYLLTERISSVGDLQSLGHMSSLELDALRDLSLSIKADTLKIKREQLDNQQYIDTLEFQLIAHQAEQQQRTQELHKEISALRQTLTKIEATKSSVVIAPTSGFVSNLQVKKGQSIDRNALLLHLLPRKEKMMGYIYVPVKLSGKLKLGQQVNIAYDAYHQHEYGYFPATISTLPTSVLLPEELLMSPVTSSKPVIKVSLALNKFEHTGIKLYPGMTLTANVVVQEKTLFKWLTSAMSGGEKE